MEGKIDRADHEGQFGKPEFFAKDGVKNRMDEKFPHHPLMRSEASYKENWEQAELNMLRKTMGLSMPLKLSMERKAASRVGHLPCLSVASKASLEALTGQDMLMGFDDMFGKVENYESMTDSPFNVMQKYLDENKM